MFVKKIEFSTIAPNVDWGLYITQGISTDKKHQLKNSIYPRIYTGFLPYKYGGVLRENALIH
jgi:hypothetical protein